MLKIIIGGVDCGMAYFPLGNPKAKPGLTRPANFSR